jgi:hypothetical protein
MILKKPDYKARIETLQKAIDSGKLSPEDKNKAVAFVSGLRLEKDMAYHLDIAFDRHNDIVVLNDLKIAFKDKTAQIDHLVLTCYSAYFIESKSVSGVISVNEYDEWTRWYGKKPVNMKSPIIQSEEHESILFEFLKNNVEKFMGKLLVFQKQLGTYKGHHYIAVSPEGGISGKGRGKYKDKLKKADQIAKAIEEHHKKHAKGLLVSLNTNDDDSFKTLSEKELIKMAEFLLANDISGDGSLKSLNIRYEEVVPQPPAPPVQKVQEKPSEYGVKMQTSICPECGKQMEILWGEKYKNYYWKCKSCGKNVSTRAKCPQCAGNLNIRKDKTRFFIYCEKCKVEGLYHDAG